MHSTASITEFPVWLFPHTEHSGSQDSPLMPAPLNTVSPAEKISWCKDRCCQGLNRRPPKLLSVSMTPDLISNQQTVQLGQRLPLSGATRCSWVSTVLHGGLLVLTAHVGVSLSLRPLALNWRCPGSVSNFKSTILIEMSLFWRKLGLWISPLARAVVSWSFG